MQTKCWTKEEKAYLCELEEGKIPRREIAKRMQERFGRKYREYTGATIDNKCKGLGYSRDHREWTEDELRVVRDGVAAGDSMGEILKALKAKFPGRRNYSVSSLSKVMSSRGMTYSAEHWKRIIATRPRLGVWTDAEVARLKALLAAGESYGESANILQEEFGRAFTKNSVVGKAKSMHVVSMAHQGDKRSMERDLVIARQQISDLRRDQKDMRLKEGLFEELSQELRSLVPRMPDVPPLCKIKRGKDVINEHLMMHISDSHADTSVKSHQVGGLEEYNFEVACARAENYVDTMLKYTRVSLVNYQFPVLWMLFYGDHTSGEIHNLVDYSYYRNVIKNCLAISRMFAYMIRDIAPHFGEIKTVWLPGNHARRTIKKEYRNPQNSWDYMIAKSTQFMCADLKAVDFLIPDSYSCLLDVNGWGFYVGHGDDIPYWNSMPWYGIERKTRRLLALNTLQPNALHYFVFGHFHQPGIVSGVKGETIINGSWSATDPYVYEKLSEYREPCQLIHGVHDKHGVSWRLPIKLKRDIAVEVPSRYRINLD